MKPKFITALARNVCPYVRPNFYQKKFEAFMRRNAEMIEPIAYRCLTLFTAWYFFEVALLPFREQYGFFLRYETAFHLKEWYKDFLIGYVLLKTAHESEGRRGHYFVLFWPAAALGEYTLTLFAPGLIHAPHRIELLANVAVTVMIFWVITFVGRICVHKRKRNNNGARVD